jgi:hyaluronoglucosaminidase
VAVIVALVRWELFRREEKRMASRAVLRQAAAAALAALIAAAACSGCGSPAASGGTAPSVAASGTLSAPGTYPATAAAYIVPPPRSAQYGGTVEVSELVCVACPAGNLRDRVVEVAADAGLAMAESASPAWPQARLEIAIGAADLPPQGYRLAIFARPGGGADVSIKASDEAGAYYGLLSMAQLVVSARGTARLRIATVEDYPSFLRRGVILTADPLDRVRFGVKYKLNFFYKRIQPNEPGVPDVIAYCRSHYVTFMSLVGYRDYLTATPRADVEAVLRSQYDLGIRSFSLNFDDIWSSDAAMLATTQAKAFNDLYAYLRSLDPAIEVAITTGAYGGVPDKMSASARLYLTIMESKVPADVLVFWTGDGVFSSRIATAGARAYSEFVGHRIGLWDNDGLRFIDWRLPLSGRDPDLATVISTYMANMAVDKAWTGSNGQFAMLTELMYAWKPETYDPYAARDLAEEVLHAAGWVGPGPARPTLPPASPLPLPRPS